MDLIRSRNFNIDLGSVKISTPDSKRLSPYNSKKFLFGETETVLLSQVYELVFELLNREDDDWVVFVSHHDDVGNQLVRTFSLFNILNNHNICPLCTTC